MNILLIMTSYSLIDLRPDEITFKTIKTKGRSSSTRHRESAPRSIPPRRKKKKKKWRVNGECNGRRPQRRQETQNNKKHDEMKEKGTGDHMVSKEGEEEEET